MTKTAVRFPPTTSAPAVEHVGDTPESGVDRYIARPVPKRPTKDDFTNPRLAKLLLPPEFILRCEIDGTTPEAVLDAFVANVCGIAVGGRSRRGPGYVNPQETERELAQTYYRKAVFGGFV